MPIMDVAVRAESVQRIAVPEQDLTVLRRLAEQVAALAQQPEQAEKRSLWLRHNKLEATRPIIFCDPENGWDEIITESSCVSPLAQDYERYLRKQIFWGTRMGDDRVIEPYINVPHVYTQSDFGLSVEMVGGEGKGAYTWTPPLTDYEKLSELHDASITVDWEKSAELKALVEKIFDGILTVRQHTNWWWSLGMTREVILLRGMQEYFEDLIEEPESVHRLMEILMHSNMHKLDFLERNGLLASNTNDTYVGSGGFGYTDELPVTGADGKVHPANMWGFLESQETLSISPSMFAEFIYPYQKPLLERFGLNCYGCCEPIDKRWHVIKDTKNLRRVSVSAWADKEKMAENLNQRFIYSYKPRATPLAMHDMDEKSVRSELTEVLEKAQGCRVEFIMKDNNTLGNNPDNVVKWCRITRELVDRLWKA